MAESRRENFAGGTLHQEGGNGPVESAIDRVGGNSASWWPGKNPGFVDLGDPDDWSNYDKNRFDLSND